MNMRLRLPKSHIFSVFHRLSANIAGLLIQNIFQFVLSIALVRQASPSDYGLYGLVFTVLAYGNAYQNATIIAPLSAHAPILPRLGRERLYIAFEAAGLALVCIFAGVSTGVIAYVQKSWTTIELVFVAFIAVSMVRYQIRNELVARQRPRQVIYSDLIYVFLGILFAYPVLMIREKHVMMISIVAALSVANIGPSIFYISFARIKMLANKFFKLINIYRRYSHEVAWQAVAVTAGMIAGTPHVIAVYALYSPAVFAPIAASGLLFGPLRILSAAALSSMRVEFAQLLASRKFKVIVRILWLWAGLLIAASIFAAFAISVAWPWILRFAFKKYDADAMAFCVIMTGATTATAFMRSMTTALITAARRYSFTAIRAVIIVPIVLALAFILAALGKPLYTLWALAASEALLLISDVYVICNELAQRERSLKSVL